MPKPACVPRRVLVNLEVCGIFNGIFEMQKSAQNEEKFAKIRQRETGGAGVYLAGIKYNAQPSEICRLLSFVRSAHLYRVASCRNSRAYPQPNTGGRKSGPSSGRVRRRGFRTGQGGRPLWMNSIRTSPPSSCPSPRGEKGRLNYPQRMFERPLSPWGERQSEGVLCASKVMAAGRY